MTEKVVSTLASLFPLEDFLRYHFTDEIKMKMIENEDRTLIYEAYRPWYSLIRVFGDTPCWLVSIDADIEYTNKFEAVKICINTRSSDSHVQAALCRVKEATQADILDVVKKLVSPLWTDIMSLLKKRPGVEKPLVVLMKTEVLKLNTGHSY
jgi:hypothetical protein